MKSSDSLPILFIIFNRPRTAIRSFESIRKFKPKRLFIASDGPRDNKEGERDLVIKTRESILSGIDWECEVQTLFQDSNLGCGCGVYTAINWFFQEVEYGVILEDDCVAESTFFNYAQQMLEFFKDDSRIGMIAGTNPLKLPHYPYSVIFSKYKSCWGWATWRRAWRNMNLAMTWRDSPQASDIIENCGYLGKEVYSSKIKIKYIEKRYVSAWDWQWYFSLSAQNQLCIFPVENQISNIGDDSDATHTSFSNITILSSPLSFPLILPEYIVSSMEFDKQFCGLSNSWVSKISRLIPHSIKIHIKKILTHNK